MNLANNKEKEARKIVQFVFLHWDTTSLSYRQSQIHGSVSSTSSRRRHRQRLPISGQQQQQQHPQQQMSPRQQHRHSASSSHSSTTIATINSGSQYSSGAQHNNNNNLRSAPVSPVIPREEQVPEQPRPTTLIDDETAAGAGESELLMARTDTADDQRQRMSLRGEASSRSSHQRRSNVSGYTNQPANNLDDVVQLPTSQRETAVSPKTGKRSPHNKQHHKSATSPRSANRHVASSSDRPNISPPSPPEVVYRGPQLELPPSNHQQDPGASPLGSPTGSDLGVEELGGLGEGIYDSVPRDIGRATLQDRLANSAHLPSRSNSSLSHLSGGATGVGKRATGGSGHHLAPQAGSPSFNGSRRSLQHHDRLDGGAGGSGHPGQPAVAAAASPVSYPLGAVLQDSSAGAQSNQQQSCLVPTSTAALLDMIGKVQQVQSNVPHNVPILVHCRDGSERSGVYVAISLVLERLKNEAVVDVFQSVKMLQAQRTHIVQSVAQYEFIYKAVLDYLESFR